MNHKLFVLLAASLLEFAVGISSGAQTTARVFIAVGDTNVKSKDLHAYVSGWKVTSAAGDRARRGEETSSDVFEANVLGGRPVWRQIQRDSLGTTGTTEIVVTTNQLNFAPVSAVSRDARDGSFRAILYRGLQVEVICGGHLCPPNMKSKGSADTARRMHQLEEPVFDYWGGSFGMLLAVMPLSVANRLEVPVFHPLRGLVRLQMDVIGVDTVIVEGQSVPSVKVLLPQSGFVYHIGRLPPYWLSLDAKGPDGTTQEYRRVRIP